ncbi:MAG TPA: four helix bundle protein [Gemmatimonadaceae bacterium]|nr:four helix bundle protein [Gemmatimonadaceae bacterium]
MDYEAWEASMSPCVRSDPLWRMSAYRLGEYVADEAYPDVVMLERRRITRKAAEQLFSALGSIPVNLAEGYSRSSGLDRVRFFEYALGSARESRSWYLRCRAVLGQQVVDARIELLARIISLLLVAIPSERQRAIRKSSPPGS